MYTAESLWSDTREGWPEELRDVISDFEEFEAKHWLSLHHHDPDDSGNLFLLYHYTDLKGLQGIVESQKLWSTHARFLNDAQEIKFGVELIEGFVDELMKGKYEYILRGIISHVKAATTRKITHETFVTCFCAEPDLLSQWRGYSRGGGYALGFRFDNDTRICTPGEGIWVKPSLRKVIYQKEVQEKLIRKFLEFLTQHEVFSSYRVSKPGGSKVHSRIASLFIDMALSFKHEGFCEEEEWRLLRLLPKYPTRGVYKLRKPGDYLIPYLETEYGVEEGDGHGLGLPLQEVYTGPTLEAEMAKTSVEYLLREHGFDPDSLEIESSDIPFRKL